MFSQSHDCEMTTRSHHNIGMSHHWERKEGDEQSQEIDFILMTPATKNPTEDKSTIEKSKPNKEAITYRNNK